MGDVIQSVLAPAGIQAARIAHLWWVMFWVCTVVFILVVGAMAIAVTRGRRGASDAGHRVLSRNVAIATAASIAALLVLLTHSVVTGRALETLKTPDAVRIQITGYQWWWDVEYLNPQPSLRAVTANEIHIPVGRPVGLTLLSSDVIHSLWIPNLHGKIDLIPGRVNEMWIQADRPGVYRGQCAEFCGLQHAKMAITIVAEPPDQFEGWVAHQREPAPPPTLPSQQRGLDIVERGPCAMCHTIAGTTAGGRTAPDLTHIASRSTLAAGTVPNTRGYLAGWIVDPQHVKPGNKMPPLALSSSDLQALLDYLETLK